MGGYECADHINRSGNRVNLLVETEHDIRVLEDYNQLLSLGIKVVREGICWSSVEKAPYVFDFSEVLNRMEAAASCGIQIIWDLCHFGYPDGLFPTHPHFCDRFVMLAKAFADFHKAHSKQPLFVIPINEISFLSWHSGDVRGTVPFAVNAGFDMKYHLCKAAILAINQLREADPDCTIMLVEPLIHVHQNPNDLECQRHIGFNESQFQAMDIISGKMCPELGGSENHFDLLGFNYYYNCQWYTTGETLEWPEVYEKRLPLSLLLQHAYNRYKRPFILSETGHFGAGRVDWIQEVTIECLKTLELNIPLLGICIYPITDRPDWDDLSSYSNCGIWDLDENKNRVRHQSYFEAVKDCVKIANEFIELNNHNPVYIPSTEKIS